MSSLSFSLDFPMNTGNHSQGEYTSSVLKNEDSQRRFDVNFSPFIFACMSFKKNTLRAVYVSSGTCRGQSFGPVKLEFQVVASRPAWVLGTKPGSFARLIGPLKY